MRVEQETRVEGWKGARDGGGAARGTTMSLRLWSRAVVLERVSGGTHVLTVTDSARIGTTDPHAREAAARAERMLAGRAMRLRVAADGTARLMGEGNERELSSVVAAMPAAFPHQPVAVGEKWRREMPVPAADGLPADDGIIRAVFRLDSLTHGGAYAWVSLRGELSREAQAGGGGGGRGDMTGTLSGLLVLDRRRGWLDESRFALDVHTVVAPPSGAGGEPPLRVVTRVQQRMQVLGSGSAARGARP